MASSSNPHNDPANLASSSNPINDPDDAEFDAECNAFFGPNWGPPPPPPIDEDISSPDDPPFDDSPLKRHSGFTSVKMAPLPGSNALELFV